MSPVRVLVLKVRSLQGEGCFSTGEIFFSQCWIADPREKLETSSLAFLSLRLFALIFIFLAAGGRKGAGKVMLIWEEMNCW